MEIQNIGKLIIVVGVFIVVLGILIFLAPKIPYIGRLPGDFHIKRDNFSLYFPLATSIIVSIVLTLILNLIFRWK